jgi:acyl carrier protein
MNEEKAFEVIKASLEELKQTDIIENDIDMDEQTLLLGENSALDSMAFVAFLTDLEERINDQHGRGVSIVLNDIEGFNTYQPHLTVQHIIRYILRITAGE